MGEDKGCQNVTSITQISLDGSNISKTLTNLEPIPLSPLFSVSTYFLIIFCFLLISTVSFFLLNFLNVVKNQRPEPEINLETKAETDNTAECQKTLLEKEAAVKHDSALSKENLKKETFEKRFLLTINFLIT